MHRRAVLAAALFVTLLWPVAGMASGVADLARALQFDRLFAILSEEGIRHGHDLQDEMFPGDGSARWDAIVVGLHDRARMQEITLTALEQALSGEEAAVARITAYLASDEGARFLTLELAAREALLDDSVRDAATEAWEAMQARSDPRLERIGRFIAAGDLIERNVAGALNSNLAFYQGLDDGGAPGAVVTDTDMMADLWTQEPMIRAEAEEWLWSYLAMAYQPLGDDELDRYIAFSESPDGILLNSALFSAFDALFASVSRDLGVAVAGMLKGQDI